MSLADLRDLVIIVWGVAGIVLLVMLMVLALIIYRKVRKILDTVNNAVAAMQGIASFATGLRKGFEAWSKLRRKEEDSG